MSRQTRESKREKTYREALEIYADEKNWGNGGWEGHPNDYFQLSAMSKHKVDRAWKIARRALRKKVLAETKRGNK